MDSIFKRRSIRKYTDEKISKEDIVLITKAGMNAPSARNLRPCSYIIIDDKHVLESVASIDPHAKMLNSASHAIAVCAKEVSEFWPQDAAASTENILLGASNLGVSSCWCGIYPTLLEEPLKELLNMPNDIRLFSIIALGYPDELKEDNNFYEESKVHYNKW